MHHFHHREGELYCEEVPIGKIAKEVGTPFYLYSKATFTHHATVFEDAFTNLPHLTAFAVKACPNIAILSLLAKEGLGADIVSGGELYRAKQAEMDMKKVVFSGVGKTKDEIAEALDADILMFSAESVPELLLINRVAADKKKTARVALRVNPDVDPKTHPYVATGLKESKFGFPMKGVLDTFKKADAMSNLKVIGVHQHIGSQITQIPPFAEAIERTAELIGHLHRAGMEIEYLDIGGGIGIPYDEHLPPSPAQLSEAIEPIVEPLDVTLVTEPGRVIAGNAGILVTQVLRVKNNPDKTFVVVDGAMNDLMRPTLYDAYHEILPVFQRDVARIRADVVGPICESGDFLAKNRKMHLPTEGDLLAIMSTGAYGFSMASTYNSRPRVPELLVDGNKFHVIREREKYDSLTAGEKIPWK